MLSCVSMKRTGDSEGGSELSQLLERIQHLKQEHGLERNHLLGQEGDRINALLTGCGFNLRKLWRFFKEVVSFQPA